MHENKESCFYSQAFVTCVTNSVSNFNVLGVAKGWKLSGSVVSCKYVVLLASLSIDVQLMPRQFAAEDETGDEN